jgi:hypothetical protein
MAAYDAHNAAHDSEAEGSNAVTREVWSAAQTPGIAQGNGLAPDTWTGVRTHDAAHQVSTGNFSIGLGIENRASTQRNEEAIGEDMTALNLDSDILEQPGKEDKSGQHEQR